MQEPRSSGGIGDVILRQSFKPENRNRYWVRYFFDLSCFLVINLIILNVLLGIIIDTFAQLRDKKKNIEESNANECFVCSLKQDRFGKDLNGFDRHRERDHNIWNYLYFMYYLQNKESTELSGVESYVKELIIKEDSSWVPLLRTAKIDEKESSEKCEENIDILLETIAQLNKELDTNPDIVRSFAPLK